MKKIIMLLVLFLTSGGVANAQLLDSGVNASVKANVGVGQRANASTSADANAYGTAEKDNMMSATGTVNANSGVRTAGLLDVEVKAKAVKDLTPQEKRDFLLTVKDHAQLQSGQDLELFAKGVIAADANVKEVAADDSHVELSYKMPAKFLGLFRTELNAHTDVEFDEKATGNGPKEVTVRFPWYRMFYSLDSDVRSSVLKTAIEASVNSEVGNGNATTTASVSARNGQVIQLISNILRNIRASVDAQAAAEVK